MKKLSTLFARFVFGAIVSMSVLGFVSCTRAPVYSDGEYIATSEGRLGPIEIKVTVVDGTPVSVEVLKEQEHITAQPAEDYVIKKFLEKKSTSRIAVYSGATVTTNAMIEAINSALEQAASEVTSFEQLHAE